MINNAILFLGRARFPISSSIRFPMRLSSSLAERFVHPDRLQYQKLTPEEMNLKFDGRKYLLQSVPDSKFCGKQNPLSKRAQYIWQAECPISVQDIQRLCDQLVKKGQSVHINTGTHGDADGKNVYDSQEAFYAETGFLKEDILLTWKEKNASFHIVSKDSQPTRPVNANHIIDAWCYSANKSVREIKEEAEKYLQQNHSTTTQSTTGPESPNFSMGDMNGPVYIGFSPNNNPSNQKDSYSVTAWASLAKIVGVCVGGWACYKLWETLPNGSNQPENPSLSNTPQSTMGSNSPNLVMPNNNGQVNINYTTGSSDNSSSKKKH